MVGDFKSEDTVLTRGASHQHHETERLAVRSGSRNAAMPELATVGVLIRTASFELEVFAFSAWYLRLGRRPWSYWDGELLYDREI